MSHPSWSCRSVRAFALWTVFSMLGTAPLGCDVRGSRARESRTPSERETAPHGPPPAPAPFVDVTREVGLDFTHVNGMSGRYYFVEMMGSGGGFIDFDGDGDLDLYLVQGGPLGGRPAAGAGPLLEDRLYRNDLEIRPDGSRILHFTDVTEASGIRATGYGMGVATGDYDNDGWPDLYVTNWGHNQLWHNNGDGTFTDVTRESGTDDARWSTGASFVDFDLDGWLDLMVVNYVRYAPETDHPCYSEAGRRDYCGPDAYPPEPDRLFRNRRDGTFEDVTFHMGLSSAYGPGLGVVAGDFNGDGWPDLYVANDGQENQLWMNRGGDRFENDAVLAGAAVNGAGVAEASMGVDAEDFDGDGNADIFVTHLNNETNTFYANAGAALFEDRTRPNGLDVPSRPFTGFGTAPIDYDNDGWLDLFVANGEVKTILEQAQRGEPLPLRQRNQLFRNLGGGRFREVTVKGDPVLDRVEVSRGTAYGDVDNDGDADLLLFTNNGPARLLLDRIGNRKHWLGLRLVGTPGGRDMLGARVALVRRDGRMLWRRAHTDGSYCSAQDPRVLFGLDDDPTYDFVRVYWPGGGTEVWRGLAVDRYHTLAQGRGSRTPR